MEFGQWEAWNSLRQEVTGSGCGFKDYSACSGKVAYRCLKLGCQEAEPDTGFLGKQFHEGVFSSETCNGVREAGRDVV